jgi:hypothetical protein
LVANGANWRTILPHRLQELISQCLGGRGRLDGQGVCARGSSKIQGQIHLFAFSSSPTLAEFPWQDKRRIGSLTTALMRGSEQTGLTFTGFQFAPATLHHPNALLGHGDMLATQMPDNMPPKHAVIGGAPDCPRCALDGKSIGGGNH